MTLNIGYIFYLIFFLNSILNDLQYYYILFNIGTYYIILNKTQYEKKIKIKNVFYISMISHW